MLVLSINAIVSAGLLLTVVARGGGHVVVAASVLAGLGGLVLSFLATFSQRAQLLLMTMGIMLGVANVVGSPDVLTATLFSLAAVSSLLVGIFGPRPQVA